MHGYVYSRTGKRCTVIEWINLFVDMAGELATAKAAASVGTIMVYFIQFDVLCII